MYLGFASVSAVWLDIRINEHDETCRLAYPCSALQWRQHDSKLIFVTLWYIWQLCLIRFSVSVTFFETGRTDIRTNRLFSENIILEAFLTFFSFSFLCVSFSHFLLISLQNIKGLCFCSQTDRSIQTYKKKQESLVGDIQKLREQKWDFFGMCMQLDCNCFESEIVQEGLKNYKILST